MVAKKRAPHGTIGAARRHQRAGDPLCDACAVAMREYRRKIRQTSAESVVRPLEAADGGGDGFALPEPLDELRAQYRAVVTAMDSPRTPATALASLSSRREALYRDLRAAEDAALHRRLVESVTDPEDAFRAVVEAGGTPLDALIARTQARLKDRETED